jgi:biopolymer transport protein ExbD
MAGAFSMASSGGGGRRRRRPIMSEINVTPFVDVMLVLLIIFMVTAPLATTSIKIDLPPAKAPPPNAKDKPPTYISISKAQIFVSMGKDSMKPSSLDMLATDLPISLQSMDPHHETIFIRADKDVKYKQFMDVINQLQTDGYFKIGLISEEV